MKTKRKPILKPVPFIKLLPNIVTLIGLVIGVSSIRFALEGSWQTAVYCIIVAIVMDALDGRVARMFNATSHFGAELDSLCDFVNFGLCPALILYLWSFGQYDYKVISWTAMMVFVVCMALRLARFNTELVEPKEKKIDSNYFFTGIPAPIGGLLALIPMIIDFDMSLIANSFIVREYTLYINIYIIILALLLPSKIPTISLKKIHIKPEYLSLIMVFLAVIIILTVIYPWYVLPIAAIIYIISIPICIYVVYKV